MRSYWRRQICLVVGLLLFPLILVACDPSLFAPPTVTPLSPTFTATASPTATSTRIWFPSTNTAQPPATQIPIAATPDIRPVAGQILFEDAFEPSGRWGTTSTAYGSIAFGISELTIAIKEPRRSLYSFYLESLPDNYYAEITVNPSLCLEEDMYGIAFRTQSNSQFYRLVFRCDGQLRIDLVQGNAVATVANLEASGQFLPGTMQKIRAGLWLHETGVRVYLNDVYQFGAERLLWRQGGMALFARSASGSLTVNYSDLVIRESSPFPPTPEPMPSKTPTVTRTPLRGR